MGFSGGKFKKALIMVVCEKLTMNKIEQELRK